MSALTRAPTYANVGDVRKFGARGAGADETAMAAAALSSTGRVYVPRGFTLAVKNLQMQNGQEIQCDGVLKLPAACSDFDRMIYATGKTGLQIKIAEIDGNAVAQAGNIGTHLIYLTGCTDFDLSVQYLHDHYVASGAAMPSVDGIRNTSSGPVFLQAPTRARVDVGRVYGWGREAVYLLDATDCRVSLGHALGKGFTEYSGLQVSGTRNKITHASVDNCGASGIGIDCTHSQASNLISRNTRENHGINIGHPGRPATGTVISNVVVDGCQLNGINFQSSSQDVTISGANISNAGQFGINASDGVLAAKVSGGVVSGSGRSSYNAFGADLVVFNVKGSDLDAHSLLVTMSAGTFVEGETITTATGSGVARRVVGNLSYTEATVFVPATTGTWTVGQVLTGGSSGATATISAVRVPVKYTEGSGGAVVDAVRYAPGSAGDQVRFADGSAILFYSAALPVAAGALTTLTVNFASNVIWTAAPIATACISSANVTGNYTVQTCQASATTAVGTVKVKADVAQTYGVTLMLMGRWK